MDLKLRSNPSFTEETGILYEFLYIVMYIRCEPDAFKATYIYHVDIRDIAYRTLEGLIS